MKTTEGAWIEPSDLRRAREQRHRQDLIRWDRSEAALWRTLAESRADPTGINYQPSLDPDDPNGVGIALKMAEAHERRYQANVAAGRQDHWLRRLLRLPR